MKKINRLERRKESGLDIKIAEVFYYNELVGQKNSFSLIVTSLQYFHFGMSPRDYPNTNSFVFEICIDVMLDFYNFRKVHLY